MEPNPTEVFGDSSSNPGESPTQPLPSINVHSVVNDDDESLEVPSPFLAVTDPRKRAYLMAQALTPSITAAAAYAGITPKTAWNWKHRAETTGDTAYLEALKAARDMCIEFAESEAWQRAIHGTPEPVFGQISEPIEIEGKNGPRVVHRNRTGKVGEIMKKSDTLMIFMLKAARPKVYRERIEHTGEGGGPIKTQVVITLPHNGREALPEGSGE